MTSPKLKHTKLQNRLLDLLRSHLGQHGQVAVELPFRAIAEYDLRSADVAFVRRERWDSAQEDDYLHGAPELVIEVRSPFNSDSELREKAALCLANGSEEFWVVDPRRKTVTVMRRSGGTFVYPEGEKIPVAFAAGEISVTEIFA